MLSGCGPRHEKPSSPSQRLTGAIATAATAATATVNIATAANALAATATVNTAIAANALTDWRLESILLWKTL